MNFITKQIEKKVGMDLNGDGVVGSGRGYQQGHAGGGGAGGGLMNQIEKVAHVDLNGDGRVGGGGAMGHQQYNQGAHGYPPNNNQYGPGPQYNQPGYPQNYNQCGGGPGPQYNQYPPNYNQFGGGGQCPGPQNYGQYGGAGYGQNPHQGGGAGGGNMIDQMEKATGMDLNGDGRVGSNYGSQYNQQGHHHH